MRVWLICSLLPLGVLALTPGCAPEDRTADDAEAIQDDLKGGVRPCKAGKSCDGGTDAALDADAAPAATCTSFTYSAYGACQPDNTQTRMVVTSLPAGCMGGAPALSQACVYTPPAPAACESFTYSAFGACQPDSTQTRTVATSSPEGCMGGAAPVLSQACVYTAPVVMCTSFTYSAYAACQPNNTQTRTVTASLPAGCTGGAPVLSQACVYTPPTCTSFMYSDFNACQPDNTQTRTVVASSPMGCIGGSPVLSQACVYTPPGPRDYKTFDGTSLTANRAVGQAGVNRRRVKPYSALQTELPRVLGNTPASLAGASATFGAPPVRWYEETLTSAVALQKSLDVAFDGCLTYTATAAQFSAAPTTASATTQCTAMARRFWSHAADAPEVQACVTVATTGSASEPDVRRRWAYACSSLLISSAFLTY